MESLPKIHPVESGRAETALEKAQHELAISRARLEPMPPIFLTEEQAKTAGLPVKPVVRGAAEIRWSVSQIIERMQTTRLPAGDAQRDNFILALRHLEDAHHRLTLALE